MDSPHGKLRNPRIAWLGFHSEGVPALIALVERGTPPVCAVTLTPDAAARRSARADISGMCREFDIPLLETASANSVEAINFLRRSKPDLLVVLGWSQILSDEVLGIPSIGTLGAHAAYLPHNRGSAPVNWAIILGETESGNSLMWLNAGVDTGEIVRQVRFPIRINDSCETLYREVATSNRDMLLWTLDELAAGRRPGKPQAIGSEAVLPRRRPEDGVIVWARSSLEVYNLVRGITDPYPGAFTHLENSKLIVWSAALPPAAEMGMRPGTIIGPVNSPVEQACGVAVACNDGPLHLLRCELDGEIIEGSRLSELLVTGLVLK